MKLQELIKEILESEDFQRKENQFGILDETIYGEELIPYVDRIKQCDEFSECDEIVIMKYPVTLDENNNTISSETYKVGPNQKFKGKCYLLSLALTPVMYDPKKMYDPILDGACITPTIYDPQTFEPKKKIIIEFSPEVLQEEEKDGENELKNKLHETLDKIFENPELYQAKGEQGVLVRGIFEEVESNSGVEIKELFGLNTDKITHASVFFFESDTNDKGYMGVKLSKINIPIELKEKYDSELGAKSIHVTREEIEEFLTRNTQ
jgi:hypothetical protein